MLNNVVYSACMMPLCCLVLLAAVVIEANAELAMSSACETLKVSGQSEYQPQHSKMGLYQLQPKQKQNGKSVYQSESRDNYLYYLSTKGYWVVGHKAGSNHYDMYLHSTATIPITNRLSGTWHVKVDKGSKKVLGSFVPTLQLTVRCESRSINSEVKDPKVNAISDSLGGEFGIEASAIPKRRFSTKVIVIASVAAAFTVLVSWTMLAQQIETATEMVVQSNPGGDSQQPNPDATSVGETKGLLDSNY